MEKKMISIIVPIFNVEEYLEKCIDSILCQTYINLEIILVNDGSTDGSGKIIDMYKLRDNRIIVIHKENGGLSDARNVGIDKANGEYLCFIDSDDYVEPNMVESLYHACIDNSVKVATCGRFFEIGNETRLLFCLDGPKEFPAKKAIDELLNWGVMDSAAWDKMYHYSLFENIRFPRGRIHEDIIVTYRIIQLAHRIIHVGCPLYHYIKREKSITNATFSTSRMDLIRHAQEAQNAIVNVFPDLKFSTQYFVAVNALIILREIRKSSDSRRYKHEIWKLKKSIIKNFIGYSINKKVRPVDVIKAIAKLIL